MSPTFRSLRTAPIYAAVAIISLALGIGANVTVFSAVNALLLKPLPVPDPGRLIRVGRSTHDLSFGTVSFLEYKDLEAGARDVAEVVAHFPQSAILDARDEPRQAWLEVVSANYFSALRVPLALGHGFLPADDEHENLVIVLSDALWRNRFGADPAIIGRTLRLNGHPFTVTGVAPATFRGTFTGFAIEAWVPARTQPISTPRSGSLTRRDDRFLMLLARLAPGVSAARAQATFDVIATRLQRAQGDTMPVRIVTAGATGVHPFIAQIVGGFLGLLQTMVGLVLLIACVNLAGVLLVRTSSRRRELAVRVALGASPKRIVRLVLAESALIAAAGGALGLALAFWLCRAIEHIDFAVGIPLGLSLEIDTRVAAAAVVVTFATAAAFGLGPALSASRASPVTDLRAGAATADPKRRRTRNALVVGQVIVATILLVASSLLLRSLRETTRVSLGFDPANIQLFSASPELLGYDTGRDRALWRAIVERVSSLPGVEAAAVALWVPLGSRSDALSIGRADTKGTAPMTPYNYVDENYFNTMRIPLVAGRAFARTDDAHAPFVAVVSRAMARELFPNREAVGQQLRIMDRGGTTRLVAIVGIAADIKLRTMGEGPRPIAYLPTGQWDRPDMVLHIRTNGAPAAVTRRVLDEIRALEPNLAVETESMSHATAFALIPLRVASVVLGFAGLVGVVLAAIGVFGLVAYSVSLRTREIGLRMALGARAAQVVTLIGAQGLRPVLIGLGIGLALALVVAQALRGLLVGIGPFDPVTLVAVCVVLLGSAGVALVVPVRRAVGVDPASVLRSE